MKIGSAHTHSRNNLLVEIKTIEANYVGIRIQRLDNDFLGTHRLANDFNWEVDLVEAECGAIVSAGANENHVARSPPPPTRSNALVLLQIQIERIEGIVIVLLATVLRIQLVSRSLP